MEKTYYIGCTNLGADKDSLLSGFKIISGKSGTDALFNYYGRKFKRDGGRNCDVVITECRIVNGEPRLCGRTGGYSVVQ